MSETPQSAALAYAKRGWPVFPCRGKKPLTKHGFHDATRDVTAIEEAWGKTPAPNIGMATGEASGVWVLDVDGAAGEASLKALQEHHGALPPTVVGLTGGGGRHLLFRYRGEPIRNTVSGLGDGLDVRATGGYIIVPPSIHPETGAEYQWDAKLHPDLADIADAPPWLIELVCGPRQQRERQSDRRTMEEGKAAPGGSGSRYGDKALDDECRAVAQMTTGSRNARLNTAAFNLGQLVGGDVLKRGDVERELYSAAAACGLLAEDGEAQVLATIKSGLDKGIDQPRKRPEPAQKTTASGKANGSTRQAPRADDRTADAAPGQVGDWYERAYLGSKGQVLSRLHNVMMGLREDPAWAGVLAYDEMQATVLLCKPIPRFGQPPERGTYPRPVRDDDVILIQEWFLIAGLHAVGKDVIHDAVERRARECGFHPVRDYLDGLKWDGVERLETWLHVYLGAEDTPYTRAIGRMFMVSAVARILRPGCKVDYMMVLEGRQGVRKSTACRILGGEWFGDSLPENVASKDAAAHLRGKWMIEFGEMHALSKSETTALKAFISRQVENYRPSYGRKEVHEPRQCVFIGTTNKAQYLKDETGARRFWPVKVAVGRPVDTDLLAKQRDQLFAEAVHRFGSGEPWWPDDAFEREHIQPEQEARFEADLWEGPIRNYLEGKERVLVVEVARTGVGMDTAKVGTADQRRITGILERLGWESAKKKDSKGNRWWVISK
jgi:hypothetical protein